MDAQADVPPTAQARRPLPGRVVWVVWFVVAGAWLVLDQATKVLAVAELSTRTISLGFMDLNLVRNPNAAFGIPGFTGMFVLVTIVVVVLIARAIPRSDRLSVAFAYGLITGGALGNGLDRVFRAPGFPGGHVVDMFDLGWFPVFNIADTGITVGTTLLVVLLLRADREERLAEAARAGHTSVRPGDGSPRR